MNPESFHFLWDELSKPDGNKKLTMMVVLIPTSALFLYLVERWRVRPIVVWAFLSVVSFAGSQFVPENRSPDQRR
jgi:hypothetical protein